MSLDRELLDPAKLPEKIREHAPWLSGEYMPEHAWVPVKYSEIFLTPTHSFKKNFVNADEIYGVLPNGDISNIKPGDIIIFGVYDSVTAKNKKYEEDRFEIVSNELYREILISEPLHPKLKNVIIVSCPEKSRSSF